MRYFVIWHVPHVDSGFNINGLDSIEQAEAFINERIGDPATFALLKVIEGRELKTIKEQGFTKIELPGI